MSGKEERGDDPHEPPIPHSVQEQEDTREISSDGQQKTGTCPGLCACYFLVYHHSKLLITHPLELTVNLPVFAPGGPSPTVLPHGLKVASAPLAHQGHRRQVAGRRRHAPYYVAWRKARGER
jgi:hypothetical protein